MKVPSPRKLLDVQPHTVFQASALIKCQSRSVGLSSNALSEFAETKSVPIEFSHLMGSCLQKPISFRLQQSKDDRSEISTVVA